MICGMGIQPPQRWATQFRAGVKVTVPLCMAPSEYRVRIPADAVTDEWTSERIPEHDQTDLYLFHEPCWQRLVKHFSPHEFDVGYVFEALEYLPLPSFHDCNKRIPFDLEPPYMWDAVDDGPESRSLPANLKDLMKCAKARPMLRCPVSRGAAPIFGSLAFWKTRFDLNAERGFLWPVVRDLRTTEKGHGFDWRLLYHCTCHLNCSYWFRLELKSWEALRWLRDTALALASGTPRPLDNRGDALHYYHNAMVGNTHLEVVDIDSRVLQIAVSAHMDCDCGSVCITGLEFFFENRPKAILGYTSPGATQVPGIEHRNYERPWLAYPRVRVLMDLVDFKGILVTREPDGVYGVFICQSMDEYRKYGRQHREYSVGLSDYGQYMDEGLCTASLEEVTQVVAVFDVSIYESSSLSVLSLSLSLSRSLARSRRRFSYIYTESEVIEPQNVRSWYPGSNSKAKSAMAGKEAKEAYRIPQRLWRVSTGSGVEMTVNRATVSLR
ncbi:hypothetical protein ASPBRDRAFT_182953 [Aspergillus brasiliensis CBS 101740]|uniref:Uncharacterized protein n=1 Tax=Aspergillus brasiliensis (strain CBS 101740 / IMI 381727 / IBT 21946) TaxID=767769 RepID=A0A1L9UDK0_ASPBC|nr:hypothetical protein ASPBRDRAFT_182953 [Aspergillus brasiliensis CBS 101740]